jgi:hypothetical protein
MYYLDNILAVVYYLPVAKYTFPTTGTILQNIWSYKQ